MKTISGKIVSSKPSSISKAARVLSKFISTETGASEAVSAYLRRASAAFNELAELHRELKPSLSNRKPKKRLSETPPDETQKIPNRNAEAAANHDDSLRKKEKDKKKKRAEDVHREDSDDLGVGRERKKRKSRDIDGDEVLNPAEQDSSKKSKKRRKVKRDS